MCASDEITAGMEAQNNLRATTAWARSLANMVNGHSISELICLTFLSVGEVHGDMCQLCFETLEVLQERMSRL